MRRPSDRIVAAALFTAFFALYAFTAQRGFGWGDSGEFQHWILDGKDISSSAGFSNLHPLYLVVARAFASSPFGVTLVSSFFGALAVAGFFFLSRNLAVAVLFGLFAFALVCCWRKAKSEAVKALVFFSGSVMLIPATLGFCGCVGLTPWLYVGVPLVSFGGAAVVSSWLLVGALVAAEMQKEVE